MVNVEEVKDKILNVLVKTGRTYTLKRVTVVYDPATANTVYSSVSSEVVGSPVYSVKEYYKSSPVIPEGDLELILDGHIAHISVRDIVNIDGVDYQIISCTPHFLNSTRLAWQVRLKTMGTV